MGVWGVWGGGLEGRDRMSRCCGEAVLMVSGGCLESVGWQYGGCGDAVWRV